MTDLLHTEEGDLDLSTGDVRYGESTRQHQKDILMALPCEYKMAPTSTAGLPSFLNDDTDEDMLREIRVKFSKDGMKVIEIRPQGTKINTSASY